MDNTHAAMQIMNNLHIDNKLMLYQAHKLLGATACFICKKLPMWLTTSANIYQKR